MYPRKTFLSPLLTIGICLLLLTTGSIATVQAASESFSFAVVADPRGQSDTWKNALSEIRDLKAKPKPEFSPAKLIVAVGDMDPLVSRYEDYRQVFPDAGTRPLFLPVIGNHELDHDRVHYRFARDILIPAIPGVVRRHPASCDYYLDHKNARIIVVDGYTDLGKNGVINDEGRHWVERVIKATPSAIAHIFIALHEPAFPRIRHVGDSFDKDPGLRNAFWRMLLGYKDRVRAVLVGHTHSYSRLRVLDPAGASANNPEDFPDEAGGIYQVDAGAAGNGSVNTVVNVQIEGETVLFKVFEAANGANKPFTEIDKWSIVSQP